MTDRSNYGPIRRLSPPVSTDTRKPYSRTGLKGVLGTLDLNSGDVAVSPTPDSPYYPFHVETPQLEPPSQNRRGAPDGPRDIAGFPTYEQYQRIEEEYLTSLSQRKQPKALISQALFDKIFAMFVLVYPQTSFNHNAGQTPESVVLHDKRPVAIKEQLYEVLCYCHALARHGGRDKTCATLRLHYSWVPKELTAKFVKACPTCTLKRSGNPDLISQFGQTVPTPYAPTMSAELASLPGGPNDSPPGCLSFIVGSSGCDDGCADFAPSIFATPDLSVYPSPTLSTGSFGPMTPSPYLPSGLFGYPAMFDPGHSSLSCVAGWEPSPLSPCVPMCVEELCIPAAKQRLRGNADEIIDARSQGMQTHLPTPKVARSMRTHTRGSGNDSGCGCNDDPFPGVVDTAYPIDVSNIDPLLLMGGGYPPLSLVVRTQTSASDTDTDMDPGTGSGGGGLYHLGLPSTWETPTAAGASSSYGSGRVQQQQPPPQLGLALGTPVMGVGTDTGGGAGHRIPPPVAAPTQVAGACSFRDRAHSELPPPSACPASPPLQSRTGPMTATMTTMFAPVPMPTAAPLPVALKMEMMEDTERSKFLLRRCDDVQEDEAAEDEEEDEAEDVVVEKNLLGMGAGADAETYRGRLVEAQWDSPEAWLVQSDSIDDDDDDDDDDKANVVL
ncbi:hypothetical protein BJV74DRAFT_883755 [Russula compacta]|nr:hypothetical protein BJV74DRAFT_883755 [Russula compacta]